jgi:hypothetical protein
VFLFRLLSGGSPVSGRNVTLTLNQTQKYTTKQPTNKTGYANVTLPLTPPSDGNLTYNVVASFAGDSASNATATMKTLNGTTYDVCTTTQYNSYEPSSNSTSITVTPQTTIGATTLMNPAQMQADAQSKGWLSIKNEFSWSYPWYRLCLNMTAMSPPVELIIAPLALDVSVKIYGEQSFAQQLDAAFFDIGYDVAWGLVVSHVAASITAQISASSWATLFLAIGIDTGVQVGLAYLANANQRTAYTWLISFFASLISAGGEGFVSLLTGTLVKWMTSVGRLLRGSIESVFHSWWAKGLAWNLITAIPFMFVDAFLACWFIHNYQVGLVV